MISTLSNSVRVFTLCNAAAVKSPFLTAYNIQLRDIHLHQPMLKSVEEKLGLPARPKKPATAYLRFMVEVRPTISAKNPKAKQTELISMIAKMWKSLEESKKEKFTKGYKEEMALYSNVIAKYRDRLSDDDLRKIKETKFEKKERKFVLSQQKKSRDLGKPRKPTGSFLRYFHGQKDRQPKEKHLDFVKRVSVRWNALTEAEREKYKITVQDNEQYKKELFKWEAKMRKLGHFDIVSSEVVPVAETPKPRARKPSADE